MKVVSVKMVEWFDSRFYRVDFDDGTHDFYPSATTKLSVSPKPNLAKWRGDVGNREADLRVFEASERGVRIHSAFETLLNDGIVIYNPRQKPTYTGEQIEELKEKSYVEEVYYQDEMLDVWKLSRFIEIAKPKIIATERTVFSRTFRDAGTLDCLIDIPGGQYCGTDIKGGIYVVDLKTGSQVNKDAYRQTACYFNCVKEMGLCEPTGTMILHTGSKVKKGNIPGFSVHVREKEVQDDFKSFRRLAEVWEEENPNAKPVVFDFPTLLTLKK